MIVRIARNYDYPDIARQTPGSTMTWKGIKFTEDPIPECDYLVVFNYPKEDVEVTVRKGGTILLIQEPPYEQLKKLTNLFPFFDHVFSGFESDHPSHFNQPAALPWHIGKSYDDLKDLQPQSVEKLKNVSCVTSNSNRNPGHQPRLNFLKYLTDKEFEFDLMGRGFKPIDDKFHGVAPYKYTIAIENYSAEDYWTEKIVDCFLSYTVPIYHGCQNIHQYFPEDSVLKIDINNPPEALEIIKKAIEENFWEKNIDALIEARNKVLHEYQFFPFFERFIKEHPAESQKQKVKIPHHVSDFKPSLFRRIIRKF